MHLRNTKASKQANVNLFTIPGCSTCPVAALKAFRKRSAALTLAPVFTWSSDLCITVRDVNSLLLSLLELFWALLLLAFQLTLSGLPSLLWLASFPEDATSVEIMQWGRWKSNAYLSYTNPKAAQRRRIKLFFSLTGRPELLTIDDLDSHVASARAQLEDERCAARAQPLYLFYLLRQYLLSALAVPFYLLQQYLSIFFGSTFKSAPAVPFYLLWQYISSCFDSTFLSAAAVPFYLLWQCLSICFGSTVLSDLAVLFNPLRQCHSIYFCSTILSASAVPFYLLWRYLSINLPRRVHSVNRHWQYRSVCFGSTILSVLGVPFYLLCQYHSIKLPWHYHSVNLLEQYHSINLLG